MSLERTAQRLLQTLGDSIEEDLGRRPSRKKARRVAFAAAGVALLTAASAGISSVRVHLESSSDS